MPFDTASFAPPERHEAWATRDWPTIAPVFKTRPLGDFFNRSIRASLGEVTIHLSEMGAQHYERTLSKARRDGIADIMFSITMNGTVRGRSDDRDVLGGYGAMCVTDLSRSHVHESSDSRTILITMPRAAAARCGFAVDRLHGLTVPPHATLLLREYILSLYRSLPNLPAGQAPALGKIVLDMLGLALADVGGLSGVGQDASDETCAFHARRLIEDRLSQRGLSIATLCADLRISRSKLYRLFEHDGGVGAYIRSRRLEQVRLTLVGAGGQGRIKDLADRWGFSDAPHLSRAFREQFGETPAEFRARYGGASGA